MQILTAQFVVISEGGDVQQKGKYIENRKLAEKNATKLYIQCRLNIQSLWTKMIPAIPKPGISCNYLMYSTRNELE